MENLIYLRLQRNIVGGLVSGIGSLIGGAINARAQQKQNERNIQAQAEENQKNRDFTEEMYNKYESPVAQRQQMLEAGVNPMGAISPQSVGSASTSALPPGQAPQFGSAIQQGIQSFWEAGTALREQRLKDQEIEMQKLENWKQAFENGNAEVLFQAQYEEITSRIALTREEKRLKRQELNALKLTYDKAKEAYEHGINEHVDAHNESVSRQGNLDALTATENALRDVSKNSLQQQISESKKRVQVLDAEAKKLIRETEQIENLIERQDIVNAANAFYGITIDTLPPTLQYRLMDNWQKVVRGEIYEETALRVAASAVNEYRNKELHIPRTSSWNESKSRSVGSGPFKRSDSESYGWTEVY